MVAKFSKGQSALEYLMTYGWALVVIVLVIAALVFLIDPSSIGGSSCTGFSKFPIENFDINSNAITIKVTNQTGRDVGQTLIQASFNDGAFANSNEYTGTQTINSNSGVTVTINAPNSPLSGAVTVDLNISYFDGDFTRRASATCKGNV